MKAPAIPLLVLAKLPDLLMQAAHEINFADPLRAKLATASGELQYYVDEHLKAADRVEVEAESAS